jgi:hypothetical protein
MRKESWLKNVEGMYSIWSLFAIYESFPLPLALAYHSLEDLQTACQLPTSRVGDHSNATFSTRDTIHQQAIIYG